MASGGMIDLAVPVSRGRAAMVRMTAGLGAAWRGLRRRLDDERERWILWLPVAVGCGIALYFSLDREPPLTVTALVAAVASVPLVLAALVDRLLPLALALAAVAAGFVGASVATALCAAPVLPYRLGPVLVEGRVRDVDLLPNGHRVVLEVSRIEPNRIEGGARGARMLSREEMPERVRIRLARGHPPLAPGDRLTVPAILMPPPAPAIPGAFDFQRQAYFDKLGAVGYATGEARKLPPSVIEGEAGTLGVDWRLAIARLRHAMTERIVAVLPGGTGGVAAALITGEMGPIPEVLNQAYRDSGLAHLLSISGIHMTLVAGIAFVALRSVLALVPMLALRWPIKKWSAALALLLVFAYTLLAGAPVPAQRSFLMIAITLLAVMVDRVHLSARLVAWAAVVVMLLTPVGLLGASFQMSFAAVIALVAFYETYRLRIAAWQVDQGIAGRIGLYFIGIALTTVVATVATTPFAVFHFNRFAVFALPANAIAVPITGFWIMPWAMVSCLLMPLGLEAWGLVPMGWGVDAINGVAGTVASWPASVVVVPSVPSFGLALFALGGLWICIWRGAWRRWGVGLCLAGIATIGLARAPDVVIGADARTIAVLGADGDYHFALERGGGMTAESWTRRAAIGRGEAWPRRGESEDGRLSCDRGGCRYRLGRTVVAFIREPSAIRRLCREADLVISPVPAWRHCSLPRDRIIDRIDLWRNGTHAIWIEPAGPRIETVDGVRGKRPWVPRSTPVAARDPTMPRNSRAAQTGSRDPAQ